MRREAAPVAADDPEPKQERFSAELVNGPLAVIDLAGEFIQYVLTSSAWHDGAPYAVSQLRPFACELCLHLLVVLGTPLEFTEDGGEDKGREGPGGKKAPGAGAKKQAVVADGDDVTVNYQGLNWDTKEIFDDSWAKGSPANFNTAQVVPGFSQALVGQSVGSQVLVVIPPALGYGEAGSSGNALAGQTLVFVIDILGIG